MNVSIAPLMKWSLLPVMAFVLTLSACTTTITTHVDPAPAATPVRVLTKEACMRGGWRTLRVEGQTFRNQGQCVSYFATRR